MAGKFRRRAGVPGRRNPDQPGRGEFTTAAYPWFCSGRGRPHSALMCWLKHPREKFPSEPAGGSRLAFAMEVAEDDFMGEEGHPFKSFGAIRNGAAEKLMLAVAVFDEPGGAELLDDAAGGARGDKMIQFHAISLRGGVGQRLSNQKNNFTPFFTLG